MKQDLIKELFDKFEAARYIIEGVECWSAREMQILLGYSKWENFENVLNKAKGACRNAGESVENHFTDFRKMVQTCYGTGRGIEDIALSRYACYLVGQHGDSRKQEIAFAQIYFAVQTRCVDLVEQRLLEFEKVKARKKLSKIEIQLFVILYERGADEKGFAIIRSKGDHVLVKPSTGQLKANVVDLEKRPVAEFFQS